MVLMIVSAPLLGVGMLVGLVISIFQTTTSIQEQTLTFVPKIVAIVHPAGGLDNTHAGELYEEPLSHDIEDRCGIEWNISSITSRYSCSS